MTDEGYRTWLKDWKLRSARKEVDEAIEIQKRIERANQIIEDEQLTGSEKIEELEELGIPTHRAQELGLPNETGQIGYSQDDFDRVKSKVKKALDKLEETGKE